MASNKSCHHVEDALAVLNFVESALSPLRQQDNLLILTRRPPSRRIFLHLILKLMKLCASRNAALPLDDAGSTFYNYLFRMIEKAHGVDKMIVTGETDSLMESRDAFLNDTGGKLGVMIRAYARFHTHYIVSIKEITPVMLKHRVLSALMFLQNVCIDVNNHLNCSHRSNYNESIYSWRNQQMQCLEIKDCNAAVTDLLLSSKSDILAYLQLTVQICVRNTSKLPGMASLLSCTVARMIKPILRVIKRHLSRYAFVPAKIYELSMLLKFALTSLGDLAESVKKICPDSFVKSMKVLESTATDIGAMGRRLAQRKVYRYVVAFLSPLWPFPRMQELVQYVTHHVTLCEGYLKTRKTEKAWCVASEAIVLHLNFMSDRLVKVFSCVLQKRKSLFTQMGCLNQLKKIMDALLKHPMFHDILAIGGLLYFETHTVISSTLKMNSEELLQKATHFLDMWTQWYHSVGHEILTPEEILRASLSFSFLRKVAEVAIVNFQNLTAVKSLGHAYRLAHKLRKWDIVKDVTQIIVALVSQMGLQCATAMDCNDPENTDVFLESMSLGDNGDILSLVAIATHHLHTRQFPKFLLVRDAFYEHPFWRGDKLVDDFANGVFSRLEVEFLMIPGTCCLKPMQTALKLIFASQSSFDAILHSQLECTFPTTDNFKMKSKGYAVGPWQIIHQYLCSTKLAIELTLHMGMSAEATDFLRRGLKVANKFQLVTWEAIFSSRWAELALISNDLKVAIDMIQRAQSILTYRKPTLKPGLQTCHGKPTIDVVPSYKLACDCKMSHLEREHFSFSYQNHSTNFSQDKPSSFLQLGRYDMSDQQPLRNCLILTDISACCSCCQSEIVGVCISLMSQQAEILWRQNKSINTVSRLLQCTLDMSDQLMGMSSCTNLLDLTNESGWKFCHLSQDMKNSKIVLAETAYKCAEIYFHNLYIKGADTYTVCDHVQPDIGNILSLLDTAETVGKAVGGFHLGKSIVASALLLRSTLNYLTVLKTLSHDSGQEAELNASNECFPHPVIATITSAVNIATKKKEDWDNKRSLLLLSVKEDNNKVHSDKLLETQQTTCLLNLLPNRPVFSSLDIQPSAHQPGNMVDSSSGTSCSSTEAVPESGTTCNTETVHASGTTCNTETVHESGTTCNTETVPESGTTCNTETVPVGGTTFNTLTVPESGTTCTTETIPESDKIYNTETVPDSGTTCNTETVPDSGATCSIETVPDSGTTCNTETVPESGTTCNTETVPDSSATCNTEPVPGNSTSSNIDSVSEDNKTFNPQSVSDSKEKVCRCLTGNYCDEAEEKSVFNDNIKDKPGFFHCTHNGKSAWLEKLTAYFPSLAVSQNDTQRRSYLQTALQQFNDTPHYWLYRQISQSMALCLWEMQMTNALGSSHGCSKQIEIAANLTESMHVTFQHKMAYNFFCKLSSQHLWESESQWEAEIDKQAMIEALDVLRFERDVIENFKNRLASVPADWTVVQMTTVNFDPTNPGTGQIFVTRLCSEKGPITVGLPSQRCQLLSYARRAFDAVTSRYPDAYYWNIQNDHILEILLYLQEIFLGGHKWLLRGQLECVRKCFIQTFLDEEGRRAVNIILQKHGYKICFTDLRNLLEILLGANEADVLSIVESMCPPHVTGTLIEIFMDVQIKVVRMCGGQWCEKRGPVVLILDNDLACFPWENMPDLISDTVTRIPSLANLIALWTLHTKMTKSPFKSGVERASVTTDIDISDVRLTKYTEDLAKTLKQYQDWQLCTEKSIENLEQVFKHSSFYLYFGHAWRDYRFVWQILGRAFVMLMCCNGGILYAKGKLDGDGAPLYFLMAGCPAMVGNLWQPLACHFKTLTDNLMSAWMLQDQPVSFRELLESARQASGSMGLAGSGLAVYGLPVMMN